MIFNLVEYYTPSFKTMNRKEKYNPKITQRNVSMSIAIQKFNFETNNFLNNLPFLGKRYLLILITPKILTNSVPE